MAIRKPKHEPRSIPPPHPLTADEFYALPETPGERYELYDGMLVMVPPPDFAHNDDATDIVVEVLSPSARRYDLHTKLPSYLEHGVREVWVVDTMARTVTVHRPGGAAESARFGGAIPSRIVDIGDGGLAELQPPG